MVPREMLLAGDRARETRGGGLGRTVDGTAGISDAPGVGDDGHDPDSTCLYAPALGAVFSGDTLFQGGPGATGRSFSGFPTILGSIKDKLGKLPPDTIVYTGHGDTTRIGDEIVNYDAWVARGHWRCGASNEQPRGSGRTRQSH